jgi:hypothetical protein
LAMPMVAVDAALSSAAMMSGTAAIAQ